MLRIDSLLNNHQTGVICCKINIIIVFVGFENERFGVGVSAMNQRVAMTKRLLKESLLELLEDYSISHVTVVMLCAKAGINRSTFYAHYSSPHDVLREIGYETTEEIERLIQDPSNESMKDYLLAACTYVYETKDLQKILIQNTSTDDIQNMMKAIPFDAVLPETLGDKGKATSQEDKIIATAFLTSGIFNVIRYWILSDVDKSPEEITDIIFATAAKIATD